MRLLFKLLDFLLNKFQKNPRLLFNCVYYSTASTVRVGTVFQKSVTFEPIIWTWSVIPTAALNAVREDVKDTKWNNVAHPPDSRGDVDCDQVSQYRESWSHTRKLGHIHDQVSLYATKLKFFFFKKRTYQTLIQKNVPRKPCIFFKSFCAKDGICSSKTVGGDRFLVLKNKLGHYHDQVSTNMTKFPKA